MQGLLSRAFAAAMAGLVMVVLPAMASVRQQNPASEQELAARLARARTAILSGATRPGDLIAEIQAILGADPTLAEAHLLLGLAYRTVGSDMLAEAVAEFRQGLALDPTLVAGRFYLASAYLELGRAERAREELEAALEHTPGQTQFMALLAEAERRSGNTTRALELARQIPDGDRSAPQARYYGAMALMDLGRRDEAIAELEALIKAGVSPPDVMTVLGIAYVDAGRNDDAVRMLGPAADATPTRPDLRVALARAHRQAGRLEQAEAELARALPPGANREASSFYEAVEADVHVQTALIRMAQDRIDEAEVELTAALALRPTHGPTHRHLSELYLRQNRRDVAATHAAAARQAGETLPDDLAALLAAQPAQ
jgi:tetratricopeptide (TPR) repeat protein